MARYILIDHDSGYIWGDTGDLNGPARDESPCDAALRLDASVGEFGRRYEEHGPCFRPTTGLGTSAYAVYRVEGDDVPLVTDGQDEDVIAAVERLCERVAVVTCHEAADDPR